MVLRSASQWEMGAAAVALVALAAAGFWLLRRRRPTADELERARRRFLVQSGRLSDGMLHDIAHVEASDGRPLTMLIYNYRIGGVDYDCSQDVTALSSVVDIDQVRLGFPCTVRYQPGNPQNSIVVAEEWSGLRAGIPLFPSFEGPNLMGIGQLHPHRG